MLTWEFIGQVVVDGSTVIFDEDCLVDVRALRTDAPRFMETAERGQHVLNALHPFCAHVGRAVEGRVRIVPQCMHTNGALALT